MKRKFIFEKNKKDEKIIEMESQIKRYNERIKNIEKKIHERYLSLFKSGYGRNIPYIHRSYTEDWGMIDNIEPYELKNEIEFNDEINMDNDKLFPSELEKMEIFLPYDYLIVGNYIWINDEPEEFPRYYHIFEKKNGKFQFIHSS